MAKNNAALKQFKVITPKHVLEAQQNLLKADKNATVTPYTVLFHGRRLKLGETVEHPVNPMPASFEEVK